MKILYGKHIGKDIAELESGYLLFVIESNFADWTLVSACKEELSARLKLDWEPPADKDRTIKVLESKLSAMTQGRDILLDVIGMAILCRGNPYTIQGYLNSPALLESDLQFIKNLNQ